MISTYVSHICLAAMVVLPFQNASSLPTGLFITFVVVVVVVVERQQWWLITIKEMGLQ